MISSRRIVANSCVSHLVISYVETVSGRADKVQRHPSYVRAGIILYRTKNTPHEWGVFLFISVILANGEWRMANGEFAYSP